MFLSFDSPCLTSACNEGYMTAFQDCVVILATIKLEIVPVSDSVFKYSLNHFFSSRGVMLNIKLPLTHTHNRVPAGRLLLLTSSYMETYRNVVWYSSADRFCNSKFPDSDVTGSFSILTFRNLASHI